MSVAFFLLFVTIVTSAAAGLCVSLRFFERLQKESFSLHICICCICWSWKSLLQKWNFIDINGVWESHLEHNEEVSKLIRLLMEGKTFIGNSF